MRIPSRLALATLLPLALPAQESKTQTASTVFVLEPGEHHLADLLDRAADFLGRSYLMSRTETARAVVVLQEKMILDASGCEELASQFAFSSDFVIVELDATKKLYEVIYTLGPRQLDIMGRARHLAPEKVLRSRRLVMPVTTLVPLEHLDAAALAQQLQPFLIAGGIPSFEFGITGTTGGVALIGLTPYVARAIDLIRAADAAAAVRTSKARTTASAALEQQLAALTRRVNELERLQKEPPQTRPEKAAETR
jgi:hypothetical protein